MADLLDYASDPVSRRRLSDRKRVTCMDSTRAMCAPTLGRYEVLLLRPGARPVDDGGARLSRRDQDLSDLRRLADATCRRRRRDTDSAGGRHGCCDTFLRGGGIHRATLRRT